MLDLLRLLYGTVLLRPYVFAFLAVYLVAGAAHLGVGRTLLFIPLGYALAWISEFSSIHCGFPYGDYYYLETTAGRELWVFGVPFMDSLSYVFLAYCSYSTALFVLSPIRVVPGNLLVLETRALRRSPQTLVLGAFLFVLLDIIIDPVALQGSRWFLGQIYGYRSPGLYFGIPLSNFGGWLLVGFLEVGALQCLAARDRLDPDGPSRLSRIPGIQCLGPILYASVLVFNLTVTFWIGETFLGLVGCMILFFPSLLVFFFTLYKQRCRDPESWGEHLADFPHSPARELLSGKAESTALEHPRQGGRGPVQQSP